MSGRIRQGSCPHEFTVKWSRQALIELSVSVSHAHTQNKQKPVAGTLGQMLWKRDQLDWKIL